MAYNVNHADVANYGSLIVEDKTINTDTSLALMGRYYPGYSKHISENFLHLLENFASNNAPENPIRGQLWFDTDSTSSPPFPKLMMWNGSRWLSVGMVSRTTDSNGPSSPADGDLWVDPLNHTMKIWDGTSWKQFVTEVANGTGVTAIDINDTSGATHSILVAYINDNAVAILNWDTEFTPTSYTHIESFVNKTIKQGVNIPTNYLYTGVAEKANALVYGTGTKSVTDLFIKNQAVETTGKLTINSVDGITLNNTNKSSTLFVKPASSSSSNFMWVSSKNDIYLTSNEVATIPNNIATTSTQLKLLQSKVTVNKPLEVTGNVTATNINVTGVNSSTVTSTTATIGGLVNLSSTGIFPSTTLSNLSLGDQTRVWKNIYTDNMFANTVGIQNVTLYYGKLHNSVRYNNNEILSSGTTFSLTNDVTGTANGSSAAVTLSVTLTPNIVTKQTSIDSVVSTDHILVERSTSLKSISAYDLIKSTKLIGEVISYAGSVVPDSYKLCNGQLLSKSVYSELYAVIGNTFGSTTTEFKVPNIANLITNVKYYIYAGKN